MINFKKFPLFFLVIYLSIAVFIAGAGYSAFIYFNDFKKGQKKLGTAIEAFDEAYKSDPSEASVKKAEDNVKKLKGGLDDLKKELERKTVYNNKKNKPEYAYDVSPALRGLVAEWSKDARKKGIKIEKDMQFGYNRYTKDSAKEPRDEAIDPIWKQACVMGYINKKLFACKTDKSPMQVVRVQREYLEEEKDPSIAKKNSRTARGRRVEVKTLNDRDNEFVIPEEITARKKGSLNTIAYRYIFVGRTDVLRLFLNKLKDFDAMLVVRDIKVEPSELTASELVPTASEDEEDDTSGLNDLNGGTSKNQESSDNSEEPANEKITPIVKDSFSKFTLIIEYIEVVNTKENNKKSTSKNKKQK